MEWLLLLLLASAIVVPTVMMWGFAGCASFSGSGTPLTAPTNLDAEAVDTQSIKLTWQGTAGETAVFQVFRTLPNDAEKQINIGQESKDTSFTDANGLTEGLIAMYRVRAAPLAGDTNFTLSDFSVLAHASTLPSAPILLNATAQTANQIDLAWTGTSHVTNQSSVEHRTPPGAGNFDVLATITGSKYSHTGLTSGTAHEYRVSSVANGFKNNIAAPVDSLPSNTAQAIALGPVPFQTAFSASMTTTQVGVEKYCIVQKIASSALSNSGSQIRITLRGPAAGNLALESIYISRVAASGDPYDSVPAASPGGLTKVVDKNIDGPNAIVVLSAGQQIVLGPVLFPFDPSQDFLVAFNISDVAGQGTMIRNPNVPGATSYAKPTTKEAAVADRSTGYTPAVGNLYLIEKIEVA